MEFIIGIIFGYVLANSDEYIHLEDFDKFFKGDVKKIEKKKEK